jgi:hypothetical protein
MSMAMLPLKRTVRHGKRSRPPVDNIKVLVLEKATKNTFTTCSIPFGIVPLRISSETKL